MYFRNHRKESAAFPNNSLLISVYPSKRRINIKRDYQYFMTCRNKPHNSLHPNDSFMKIQFADKTNPAPPLIFIPAPAAKNSTKNYTNIPTVKKVSNC